MRYKDIILFVFIGLFIHCSPRVKDTDSFIRLPAIISDNMVLQRNSTVPIWGWSNPNQRLNIEVNWLENIIKVVADEKGLWSVDIITRSSNQSNEMTITTEGDTVIIVNILFGEVWLASGQSNMQMPLKGWGTQHVEDSKTIIENANIPNIRLFQVRQNASAIPLEDCSGKWVRSSSDEVARFSATAFTFAQKLYKELNVPIGIIHSSWGGTKAQAWVSKQYLSRMSDFNTDIVEVDSRFESFEQTMNNWETSMVDMEIIEHYDPTKNFTTYLKLHDKGIGKWRKDSLEQILRIQRPEFPTTFPQFLVNTLYNAMIYPLIPYKIKGVIWYQGESNANNSKQYETLFPLLIENWRSDWCQGDFPFYFVQIAPYQYKNDYEGQWDPVLLRNAQLRTLINVENTGMVVTTDITDTFRIHPPNKKKVGERLALWALAKDYNKDIQYSGPIYKTMNIEQNNIRLFFNYAENGLNSKNEDLTYFEIAGDDGKFVIADAKIDNNTILVSHPKISHPSQVRLGWKQSATPNLFNGEGLPASPFWAR